jgi:5-enolpyruvylshikimate-3-phosphate synthase
LQGDRVIVELMDHLGVKSYFKNGSLELSKKPTANRIEWDFKDCPDLAQTVLPLCAAKSYSGRFTGMESLRIKETDRIAALQNELSKIGARLEEEATGIWNLIPGKFKKEMINLNTYHDHRMAMGFAPLSAIMDLVIESPEVVNKSYPGFWKDVEHVGVKTEVR